MESEELDEDECCHLPTRKQRSDLNQSVKYVAECRLLRALPRPLVAAFQTAGRK